MQEADTKEITVNIVDASIVKLALTYLRTGDYDDAEPAISKGSSRRGDARSKSDADEFEDGTNKLARMRMIRFLKALKMTITSLEQPSYWLHLTPYKK